MATDTPAAASVVVVFGGSSFMGKELVDTLVNSDLAGGAGRARGVVQLNRGNGYWGSPARQRAESGEVTTAGKILHAWVHHEFEGTDSSSSDSDNDTATTVCGDTASALGRALTTVATGLHATQLQLRVVAFSLDCAAHAAVSVDLVRRSIAYLREAAGVDGVMAQYVLISSDSAYDPRKVARSSARDGRRGLLTESDELLYDDDPNPRRRYGVCKAAIEHSLRRQLSGAATTLAVLRLPDVFGPRDNTGRWWATQLWGAAEPRRCYFPASLERRWVSVVFSRDVVAAVLGVIDSATAARHTRGAFHVAAPPMLLTDFVALILRQGDPSAGVVVVNVDRGADPSASSSSEDDLTSDDGEDACDFYPSVDVPPLDTSAAATDLGFTATPMDAAAAATGAFFRDAVPDGASFVRQRRRALEKLPRWVRIALRRRPQRPT